MILSKTSIKQLRAEAHRLKLKPVVMIGQNGLTDNVHMEIDNALSHHELVKIRLPGLESGDKKTMIDTIADRHDAAVIQAIGHVAVFYRRNRESDRFARLIRD